MASETYATQIHHEDVIRKYGKFRVTHFIHVWEVGKQYSTNVST